MCIVAAADVQERWQGAARFPFVGPKGIPWECQPRERHADLTMRAGAGVLGLPALYRMPECEIHTVPLCWWGPHLPCLYHPLTA